MTVTCGGAPTPSPARFPLSLIMGATPAPALTITEEIESLKTVMQSHTHQIEALVNETESLADEIENLKEAR